MPLLFRIFFMAEGTTPWLVLPCLVLAGFAEAAGLGAMMPVLASLAGGAGSAGGWLGQLVPSMLASLGIEPSAGALIAAVVGFFTLRSLLAFGALSYAGLNVARVATAMRRRLLEAMFGARWSFYASQHAGRFANAVSNDATRAADAYYFSAQFASYLVQGLTYAAVGLLIDWRLALGGLALGAVIAASLNFLVRMTRKASYKQTDRTAELTVFVTDLTNNVKPLKTMHRYGPLLASMDALLKRLKRALLKREVARQGLLYGTDTLIVAALGLGLWFASSTLMTPLADLVVLGIVLFQAVAIVRKLQNLLLGSVQFESSYVRLVELTDEARAAAERHGGTRPPDFSGPIAFRDVVFAHEEAAVIRDASLSIEPGSITVLQGPSGSGKTTLVDLLTGLFEPDSGTVTVSGVPLTEIDIRAWRAGIGAVPQELGLLHASVRENITLEDAAIRDEAVWRALEQAGAAEFVRAMPQGLDTDVGEMGSRLSGGERQRISLARALVTAPRLLILDEVTSALDPETESEICDNIAGLAGRYTIVAITHRPAWTRIATRLYQVEAGRVRESSPVRAPLNAA